VPRTMRPPGLDIIGEGIAIVRRQAVDVAINPGMKPGKRLAQTYAARPGPHMGANQLVDRSALICRTSGELAAQITRALDQGTIRPFDLLSRGASSGQLNQPFDIRLHVESRRRHRLECLSSSLPQVFAFDEGDQAARRLVDIEIRSDTCLRQTGLRQKLGDTRRAVETHDRTSIISGVNRDIR
jgi:hypothetical protein